MADEKTGVEKVQEEVDYSAQADSGEEANVREVSRPKRLEDEGDGPKASSASMQYVAQPLDGIWGDEEGDEPASAQEIAGAFKEYEQRPDVESRENILARENAYPSKVHKVPAADKNNFSVRG